MILNEEAIKAAALSYLRKKRRITNRSVIANEFVISKSSVRADLALLSSGTFLGIEIKSQKDSLRRLQSQLAAYTRVFDSVILILASKHIKNVLVDNLPSVEIWEFTPDGLIVPIKTDPISKRKYRELLPLMSKAEESRYLRTAQSTNLSRQDSRDAFFSAFRSRFIETSQQFWKEAGRQSITLEHLTLLSRYREKRMDYMRSKIAESDRWRAWTEAMHASSGAPSIQSFHSSSVLYNPTSSS